MGSKLPPRTIRILEPLQCLRQKKRLTNLRSLLQKGFVTRTVPRVLRNWWTNGAGHTLPRTRRRLHLRVDSGKKPTRCEGVVEFLRSSTRRLTEQVDIAGQAPENDLFLEHRQQKIFRTDRGRRYRIAFTVSGNDVLILRIRGPGQPPLAPDERDGCE